MEKNQSQAMVYGIIAVLLWSTVATAFKLALMQLSALQLMFYASLTSWLFLLIVLVFQQRVTTVISAFVKQPFLYFKLGSLNPFLYYLVLFQAYDLLPAQQAQALNYTWAITLSLLAVPILGQKLYRADVIALLMAYLGVLVISTQGQFTELEFTSPLGVILALLSTFIWAFYWLFNTKNQEHPVVSLFICFSIALPLMAIALTWQQAWFMPNFKGLLAAAYVGLFEMGLTFVLWLFAMKKAVNTAKVSNLIFISPFLSLIFIQYFLGEQIHSATLIGLALIIFGLIWQKFAR